MDQSIAYSKKDWLVHTHYGIGQIKAIEEKGISGANVRYFRIETTNSTYWMPVDQMDSEKIRPLSSPEEIQLVIAVLSRPPQTMSADHNARKNRIRTVNLQNSPEGTARLIRDLRGRQQLRGELSMEETSAIRSLKQKLVEEWSLVTGKNAEKIASILDDLLDNHQLPA